MNESEDGGRWVRVPEASKKFSERWCLRGSGGGDYKNEFRIINGQNSFLFFYQKPTIISLNTYILIRSVRWRCMLLFQKEGLSPNFSIQ